MNVTVGEWSSAQTEFRLIPINMWPNPCVKKNNMEIINQKYEPQKCNKNDKYSKVLFGPLQSYQVHFFFFSPLWFYLVYIRPIRSNRSKLVLFFPFSPIRFTLVIFSPLWFYSVHIGPIPFILSTSVDIGPIQSNMILFGPMSTLVLIYPFVLFWSYLVHLVPILSYSVHSVHFIPIVSTSVHFYALTYKETICLG